MNLGERNPVSHEPLSSTQNYALVLIFSGCEFSKFLKTVTFSAKPAKIFQPSVCGTISTRAYDKVVVVTGFDDLIAVDAPNTVADDAVLSGVVNFHNRYSSVINFVSKIRIHFADPAL
jgi:hypothetical protein